MADSEAVARRRVPAAPAYLLDAVIAALLLMVGPRRILAEPHDAERVVLLVALVLPLLARRRFPVAAFVVIAAVAFVQWLVSGPAVADVALLVTFYNLALSAPRRIVLAAAATLEFGALLAVLKFTAAHGGHILGFFFLSGLVTATGALGWSVRLRRAYLHEVEQRAARLEFERDQQAQLATSAERARVAREMHDIVAHNLAVMIALTDGASLTLHADPDRAAAALHEASRAGRSALTDMRRVLGVLRDSNDLAAFAPAPGIADLERLLTAVRHTGLEVRYETSGAISALEPGMQLSAYRIVQEAVTNTIKHAAGATVIEVAITARPDAVEVIVRDNGRGHTPSASGGHGILGMRERAAVHSGHVQAGPTGAGWQVFALLPTHAAEPHAAVAGARS